MDINLFEHEMLFVANSNVDFKKFIKKEKLLKSSLITKFQLGFGKNAKFLEIVTPIRFKVPNFTNLK